jgi:hypothetical protein
MTWTIGFDEQENIITVVNTDRCSAQDVIDQVSALIVLSKEKRVYDVLVDDTRMKMTLSLSDMQHLPKMYRLLGVPKKGRVALIFSEGTHRANDFHFYEKVAMGAGYTIKLFTDRESALQWLKGK